jgi:hypothetical protein
MTREEKIAILIEDRMWDWVYARNYDGLEECLKEGFKGYGNFSDQELDESLEEIEDKIEEIKAMLIDKKEHE